MLVLVDELGERLSITLSPGAVDRVTGILRTWDAIASSSETFWWRASAGTESLPIVEDWLTIGQMSDDDLALLGADWAPSWTLPMTDAVAAGVAAALVALGEQGQELRSQIDRP